jgi:predicted nucleic acid-binding protein
LISSHLRDETEVITSEIARFELCAALRRKEWIGYLYPGGATSALEAFDADVLAGLITVKPVNATMLPGFEAVITQCYHRSPAIPVRTLDAMHLAVAKLAGLSEIVTTDKRLRDAAARLGLTVFPKP